MLALQSLTANRAHMCHERYSPLQRINENNKPENSTGTFSGLKQQCEWVDNMKWKKYFLHSLIWLVAIIIFVYVIFSPWKVPVIVRPFTLEPMVRHGIDVPDPGVFGRYSARYYGRYRTPNTVYILGVFIEHDWQTREEVTHMVDIEELVELLTGMTMRRGHSRASGSTDEPEWMIFLYQHRHIRIGLSTAGGNIIDGGDTDDTHLRHLTANDAAQLVEFLERMVAAYVR